MPRSQRRLHINVNLQTSGAHPAAWRAPEGRPRAPLDVRHFQEAARIAERGKLDAVFLADLLAVAPDPRVAPMWSLDPIPLVAAMAVATEKVGFIVTSSTTFAEPYNLARAILSLDHISNGRVGWNVVTSYDERAALNFGLPTLPQHADRYADAAEFTDVVLGLWDSWEDDALALDTAAGVWGDPGRIHALNHQGRRYKVAGPLQVPRSPQGRPLLVQAGSSPQGRDFAARYAEAVFSVQQVLPEAQAYYADVKARARAYGRVADDIAILPGISLVIGGTEEEAWRRKNELDEIAGGSEVALRRFAGRLGLDVKELDLDRPVPEHLLDRLVNATGSKGFADATVALARDRTKTVRQIIASGGGAHRLVVGTPEQIADTMEEWFRQDAADGFNIMSDVYPSGLEAFVDHVVPILQQRGLFRTDYDGETLRSHYGAARPQNLFTADNAARLRTAS
jgi:FMN-dependent oxidoreductase (nitrilotriacetate monooxygenase family)